MKKFVVVLLALFLAVPAVTYAGSVTSMYDVTIGGYVKMDLGWQNQNLGPDYSAAVRGSRPNNQNKYDEYGSLYSYAGETRLNLGIKGPDAWGAKTSAFIEGDFRGASISSTAGVFELRHAFIKFDWAQDSLLIGQYWNDWGYIPSFFIVGNGDLNPMGRGNRQPQVRWTHTWNKNFSGFLGIYSEYNTLAGGTIAANTQNDNARSLMPHYMGEFKWQTDSCGKIGPWLTQLAFGGFYGQEKKTYVDTTGTRWNDDNVNSWSIALKGYIPIIPEKKGNKAGALGFSGATFMGQNNGLYYTSGPAVSYDAALNPNGAYYSAAATVNYGGWGQLSYYFTDNIWINGIYGTFSNNFNPNTFRAVGANAIRTNQHMFLNIIYDVNPAVRLGIEYARVMTGYAAYGPGTAGTDAANANNLDRSGTMDSVRMAAWYFF
ncbi:MAG: hypothetical protein NTX75_16075 [Proteobacteria bacterium]|nr:hypothetical protein [Pseudomonadota bacterium]